MNPFLNTPPLLDFRPPSAAGHRIIIAYDTPSARRRRKLARTSLSYAERVQQSVYEADLSDVQLRLLSLTLGSIIDPAEDDVCLYPQCMRCAALSRRLGKARSIAPPCLVVA